MKRGHNLQKYPNWLLDEIRNLYLGNPGMTKYAVGKHYHKLYGVSQVYVYRILKGCN